MMKALMEAEETMNILGQGLPRMCHVNETTKVCLLFHVIFMSIKGICFFLHWQ